MAQTGSESRKSCGALGRHNARISAVQVLYQMEVTERGAGSVMDEFIETPPDDWKELSKDIELDRAFLRKLVEQVVKSQAKIDTAIRERLTASWRLSRLAPTLRALLRAGACELLEFSTDIPGKVVLNEYVEVAKDFFDEKESGFVNAVLQGVLQEEQARMSAQLSGG